MQKIASLLNTLRVFITLLALGLTSVATAQNTLHFDGSNDFVSVANEANFDFTADFTIEATVFTPAALSPSVYSIINKRDNSDRSNFGINFSNGFCYFYANDGNWRLADSGAGVIPLNQWVRFAATYEQIGGNLRITGYINGAQVVQQTFTGVNLTACQNNAPVRISSIYGLGEYYSGRIGQVRIWNILRTPAEIISNCYFTTPQTGLVGNYLFQQGVADGNNVGLTTLTDLSGNNNHGTLNNFALTGTTSNWVSGGYSNNSCSPPTITNFTPTSGGVDTEVTITGTNFLGTTGVTIGGVAVRSFVVVSVTTIRAIVNDGFATGQVTVTQGTTVNSSLLGTPNFTRVACANPISGLMATTSVDGNGFSGIDVSWTNGGGLTLGTDRILLVFKHAGISYWTARFLPANATNFRIGHIESNSTTTEIYVQSLCGLTTRGDRNAINVTTNAMGFTCSTPINLNVVFSNANTRANVTWNAVPNAVYYQVMYQDTPDINGNTGSGGRQLYTDSLKWTVNGLTPNSFYRFRVKSVCRMDASINTPFGNFVVRQAANAVAEKNIEADKIIYNDESKTNFATLEVYPNPAQEQATINFGGNGYLTVTDMVGREVIAARTIEKTTTLDLKGLAKGLYVVKITADSGRVATQKLMVQ